MSKELLTAHQVRAVSAPGTYRCGGGLRLIVTVRGVKRWEVWFSIKGKRKERGLGVFPQVSLKDARDKAHDIKRAARDGIDLRRQGLNGQADAVTFRRAFEVCFELRRKQLSNAKHLKQWPSTMTTYVFPLLGDVPVAEVTTSQVFAVLEPIWYSKSETAKRVLQRMEVVFKSAIVRGTRKLASPCSGVAQELGTRHRYVKHHPSVSWEAVPTFLATLRNPGRRGWPATRLAFEFLIFSATRSGETREAVWAEFDFEKALWIIPKERMKSRNDHCVPLSGRCLAILQQARAFSPNGALVFEGTKGGRPLSDMTFMKQLRDAGLSDRATAHGFRSSFKTWCAVAAKTPDDVSEAALAHTMRDEVKAAYLRTDFLTERTPLMEAWATHCCSGRLSCEPHILVAYQAA